MKQVKVEEMACFRKLSKEQVQSARIKGDTAFTVPDCLNEKVQEQLLSYVRFRGETLSLDSMRGELWAFNVLCRFLTDRYKDIDDICSVPFDEMERSARAFLLWNAYALSGMRSRKNADEAEVRKSPFLWYLKRIYEFHEEKTDIPETDKDIWHLNALPFTIRKNPVNARNTLNFTGISQEKIRREMKDVFITTGRYLSLGTLEQQLHAATRLSGFLLRRHPQITSLTMLDRDVMEDYLTYINTEVTGKKSFRSELASLKSVLDTLSLIREEPTLQSLFVHGDITDRGRITGYRAYTDEEVRMWNEAIRSLPEQVARALVIHQLLGNRISETLTLKQDCVCLRGGYKKIRIFQIKRQNTVYKPANDTVVKLIEKSAAFTRDRHGRDEYVFVCEKDPEKPMSYGTIQYHLMKLIREKQLRDENGELYGVGTHSFRHTMGQRLTQMHIDDETIAALLGHSGTGSVGRYRSFGSKALADETRQKRGKYSDVINNVRKEW